MPVIKFIERLDFKKNISFLDRHQLTLYLLGVSVDHIAAITLQKVNFILQPMQNFFPA